MSAAHTSIFRMDSNSTSYTSEASFTLCCRLPGCQLTAMLRGLGAGGWLAAFPCRDAGGVQSRTLLFAVGCLVANSPDCTFTRLHVVHFTACPLSPRNMACAMLLGLGGGSAGSRLAALPYRDRSFLTDNLLARIQLIIEMILVERPCFMGV